MTVKKAITGCCVIVCLIILHCCGGVRKTVEPHREFNDLYYRTELFNCRKKVVEGYAKKDINYPIYLLNYGAVAQYAGELDSARSSFWTAYRIDEGEISEFTKGVEWLKADQRRVYELTKRESELLHFFLGLNYFQAGYSDKALIEFKKVELIDQGVSVLPIINFYSGMCYEILEKYDDAQIEYNKLKTTISKNEFPFIYLALAQLEFLLMNSNEASICFDEYCDLGQISYDESDRKNIIEQNGWQNLIIQIDHQRARTLGFAKIWVDGKYRGKVKPFDYFSVEMSGDEKLRKDMKEAGSYAARKTVRGGAKAGVGKCLPGFGCLGGFATDIVIGTDEEDEETRFWYYTPMGFSLTMLPIRSISQDLKITFYNCDGLNIGSKSYNLGSKDVYRVGTNILVNPCLDTPFYVY
jgi:tetratricopeptide (TPR) repeat protein